MRQALAFPLIHKFMVPFVVVYAKKLTKIFEEE
jgi:hypothetical protein